MNESKQPPASALLDAEWLHSDDLVDELDAVIVRMGRMMAARHVGPECCPESVTMAQALVLRMLDQSGPTKMSDIATLLAVKAPAASSAISALEREGYVDRTIDAGDRRVTLVSVTESGREALHAAEALRREMMRRYLSVLTEDDVRSLIRIHQTLMSAMDEGRV